MVLSLGSHGMHCSLRVLSPIAVPLLDSQPPERTKGRDERGTERQRDEEKKIERGSKTINLFPSESDGDLGVVFRVDHRHTLLDIPLTILAIFLESVIRTLREAGWRQGEGERQSGDDRERERGRVETTGRGREAGWR
jgi:hypothetical protein